MKKAKRGSKKAVKATTASKVLSWLKELGNKLKGYFTK